LRAFTKTLRLAGAALVFATSSAQSMAGPGHAPVNGIRCDVAEGSTFHIHAHLAILDHGKRVIVPELIGIPADSTCLYWLHTHMPDGIIHIESPLFRSFSLGDFFDIWGQPLTTGKADGAKAKPGQLRAYVNGELHKGNPRSIDLVQHADIVLEVGPPYHKPAAFDDWNGQ
jgi:hypothetical protein